MTRRALAIALTLAAVGCTAHLDVEPEPAVVELVGLSAVDAAATREAMAMWSAAVGAPVFVEGADAGIIVRSDCGVLMGGGAPAAIMVPLGDKAIVCIRPQVGLVYIIAHELGHALGLAHENDDMASVMAELSGADAVISARSVEAVRERLGY